MSEVYVGEVFFKKIFHFCQIIKRNWQIFAQKNMNFLFAIIFKNNE